MQLGDREPLLRVWSSLDKWLPKSPSTGRTLSPRPKAPPSPAQGAGHPPPAERPGPLGRAFRPRPSRRALAHAPRATPTHRGGAAAEPHLPRLGPRRGREAAWPPGLGSPQLPQAPPSRVGLAGGGVRARAPHARSSTHLPEREASLGGAQKQSDGRVLESTQWSSARSAARSRGVSARGPEGLGPSGRPRVGGWRGVERGWTGRGGQGAHHAAPPILGVRISEDEGKKSRAVILLL